MNDTPKLYRRRLIPDECILLKNDQIIYQEDQVLITKWTTLHPKKDLDHGISCYLLKDGWKISRFLDKNDNLICWYCDIIETSYDADGNSYTFVDLLADVLLYPSGLIKVVDLDEMADALDSQLITEEQLKACLRQLNSLLLHVYDQSLLNMPAIKKMLEFSHT